MKKLVKFASPLLVAALILGCKNFSTQAFRTEQAIQDVAFTAYVAYTNALSNGTLKISATESNQVKEARLKLAATLNTVEQWRVVYETNSAVKPQLQSALDAATADSGNLVNLINLFKNR